MTVHRYCRLPRGSGATGSVPPGLRGIDGAPVRALLVNGLEAWVSDVPRAAVSSSATRGQPLIDGVKAHDAVVESALDMGTTPVPARFGQRFDDELACRTTLESRAEPVSRVLAALQGFIEMTLLVTPSTRRMLRDLEPALTAERIDVEPDAFEHAPLGPGRAYLDSLRAKGAAVSDMRAALTRLGERITGAVGSLVRRSAEHQSVTRLPMLTLSHLIERSAADTYRAVAAAVPTGAELRVLVIGPRAPYSFCALRGDAIGTHGMNLAD
jgi:hypothetical protein